MSDDRQNMRDMIANIVADQLRFNQANATSDYSYVLNLMSPADNTDAYKFDNTKHIFVDRVGWLPNEDAIRYLMMGYRVWDEYGMRLGFQMSTASYDCLNSFRAATKIVGIQGSRWRPDLLAQLESASFGKSPPESRTDGGGNANTPKRTMPWDIIMYASEDELSNLTGDNLQQALTSWRFSRYKNARSCYAFLSCLDFEDHEGVLLEGQGLLVTEQCETKPDSPYPKIGIDVDYLKFKYSQTQVILVVDDVVKSEHNLCATCSQLDLLELFEIGVQDVEIHLGPMEGLSKDCDLCNLFTTLSQDGLDCMKRRRIAEDVQGLGARDFDFSVPIEFMIVRNPILCVSTKPFLVLTQSHYREYLGPLVSLRTVRSDIRGRYDLHTTRFVHFGVLSQMLDRCEQNHNCAITAGKQIDDMILIDTEDMCLVQLQSTPVFITLSYVWGTKPIFKATKSNLEDLKTPGSLSTAGISKLTTDAIEVVKEIGPRYLWQDALCIIQDDDIHKSSQIQRMADIYSESYLTIVASTSEDSDSCLPGVSIRRSSLVTVVDGMPITAHFSDMKTNSTGRIYEQRAWTFQERLLSRKFLYFSDDQVYFECQEKCVSDHEMMFPAQDRGRRDQAGFNPLHELGLHVKDNPDSLDLTVLEIFTGLVSEYTSRKMSFQSDVQNAFLGVQIYLARPEILNWSFVAGLPMQVFDWSLLWLPHGRLERRTWEVNGEIVSPPSWSWFGWLGRVSYAGYTYHSLPLLRNILPRVESFVVRSEEQEVKIERHSSTIWHKDVIQTSVKQETSVDITRPVILEFEAFTISALSTSKPELDFPISIEWLNTGPSYGMLRHGLRHGYNYDVLKVVKEHHNAGKEIDLALMALADLKFTFRGGQHTEEKLFEAKEKAVVMCIVWDSDDGERAAIGYCDPDQWEQLKPTRKTVRLR